MFNNNLSANRMKAQLMYLFTLILCGADSLPGHAQVAPDNDRSRLVVLDPAHPHGVQIQNSLRDAFHAEVYVYAPYVNDLDASYLNSISRFNRADTLGQPWHVYQYIGDDYLGKMLSDKKGDVVIIASNNQAKSNYILQSAKAGFNVLADKPMALSAADFGVLTEAFAVATEHGGFISDLPAMSMRNWVTCLLQKELVASPEVFGELEKGTPEAPAVVQENLHYYYKRIQRPTWFFDVAQQGNGVTDVTTHLADLVLWAGFPDKHLRHENDIQIVTSMLWPTMIAPEQFSKATRVDAYPEFLKPYLKEGALEVFSNGEIIALVNGTYVRFTARWAFEPPVGESDTHQSVFRGTLATLTIKPGQPLDLYVEPAPGVSSRKLAQALQPEFNRLKHDYPFISLHEEQNGWRISSQRRSLAKPSHIVVPSQQEVDRMLAKYYITTEADAVAERVDTDPLVKGY